MTPTIRDLLGKRMLFFDGAMGSLLQQNGLVGGEAPVSYTHLTLPTN